MSSDRAPLLAGSSRPLDPDDEEDILVGDQSQPEPTLQQRLNSLITRETYTKLEKALASVALLLLVVTFLFLGLWLRERVPREDLDPEPQPIPAPPERNGTRDDVCLTKQCVITASKILLDMDTERDPCKDFYGYTCGSWEKMHHIPSDKPLVGTFDGLHKENLEVLREILESDFPETGETGDLPPPDAMVDRQNFEKLQAFYRACIDEDTIDEIGVAPLAKLLDKIVNLYPVDDFSDNFEAYVEAAEAAKVIPTSNNTEGEFHIWKRQATYPDYRNLTAALAEMSIVGTAAFFEFGVDADSKNPDMNAVYLFQGGLGLPSKEYYTENPDVVDLYKEVVAELLELVLDSDKVSESLWAAKNLNKPKTKPRQFWKTIAGLVVNLETRLASFSLSSEERNDVEKTYNPISIAELRKLSPNIAWANFLDTVIPRETTRPTFVIVESPKYVEKLSMELLAEIDPQVIQYYLLWQTIFSSASMLGDEYQKPTRKLKAKLKGVSSKVIPERWETCVNIVDDGLGQLAGRYYVEKVFGGDSKKMAEDTIEAIKEAFVNNLPNLSWLDDETRAKAIEKVNAFVQKVGYSTSSPDIRLPVDLAEYYRAIEVDPKKHFANLVSTARWQSEEMWSRVGKKVERGKWLMTPQTVNAYYNPPLNEIVFPAGILQSPFFAAHDPEYLNYGGIGLVVGHELTHGFDNTGRQFDSKGRLLQWWSNATIDAFNNKTTCFVDQYSNFTMPTPSGGSVNVNGKLTLGENLADNGGLKQAYQAWKKRFDSDSDGEIYINHLLPGLESLGREKLFYVNFGRVWCQRIRPEAAFERIRTDPHSPARWRVNGAVQNSKHFAKTFQCPSGTPMNPESKCELW